MTNYKKSSIYVQNFLSFVMVYHKMKDNEWPISLQKIITYFFIFGAINVSDLYHEKSSEKEFRMNELYNFIT